MTNKKIITYSNRLNRILNNLPHAFDKFYWDMADTTYKEELFLAIILTDNICKEDALKIQSNVFPKNRLIRQILKEEVIEANGCYGKDFLGTSFYGTFTNERKLNNDIKR